MPYTEDFEKTLYNQKWLRKAYKNRNAAQVAEMIGCTIGAVLDNLRKHKIRIEPRRVVRQTGSHAGRPRKRFLSTLHNSKWLHEHYVEKKMTATDVAHLAGSSIPSALRALRVAGIEVRDIGEAKRGRPNPRRMVKREDATTFALRQRARRKTPPGPCVLCGERGDDVNHKDRDPRNYANENLERLCVGCHRRQHCEEERVMIELLAKRFKFPYIRIHHMARKRLLQGSA